MSKLLSAQVVELEHDRIPLPAVHAGVLGEELEQVSVRSRYRASLRAWA